MMDWAVQAISKRVGRGGLFRMGMVVAGHLSSGSRENAEQALKLVFMYHNRIFYTQLLENHLPVGIFSNPLAYSLYMA